MLLGAVIWVSGMWRVVLVEWDTFPSTPFWVELFALSVAVCMVAFFIREIVRTMRRAK